MNRFLFLPLVFIFAITLAHADDSSLAKDLPRDIAHNFRNLFSAQNLVPALLGSTVTATGYQFDHKVMRYFHGQDRFGSVDEAAEFLGGEYVVTGATGILFLFGQFSDDLQFRKMSYALAQGIILNGGITLAAKTMTNRMRPDLTDSFSFPSGHTSNVFTVATVLNRFYGAKAGIPAYAFAAFIGASRITKNSHYLSDVVAGATLGYIVGTTVSGSGHSEQQFYLTPAFSPRGDGFGLALHLRF